jgi:S1-C subfamily serine protease
MTRMPENLLLQQLSEERATLADTLIPRIVTVSAGRRRSLSAIRWRGPYLVTAAEPLAGIENVLWHSPYGAQADAGPQRAEIVAADLTTDVAVIRASGSSQADATPEASLRDALRLGETVAIVGCGPRGALLRWSTVSVAGAAWRSRRGGQIAQRLEFDAALDARFEGALVADVAGRIAAMQVMGPYGRSLGIPAQTIERVLRTVEQHGHLPRPYLGLRLQTLWLDSPTTAHLGRRAARIPVIAGVDADSPAARAGVELGDLIETIDDQEVDGVDAIQRALTDAAPGSTLVLRLRRGGKVETRALSVVERPRAAR